MKEKIFILGFGRSGTTWLSDIVSKSLGGIILFEPMHPEVMDASEEFCYYTGNVKEKNAELSTYFNSIEKKDNKNKWLLRNHINSSLEDVSGWYTDKIWEECNVLGHKCIRGNFLIEWIHQNLSEKIVFIKRHPLAVLASLKRRNRFWKEFGIEKHLELFNNNILNGGFLKKEEISKINKVFKSLENDLDKGTYMWGVTHLIVERLAKKINLPIFEYENFYFNPFQSTRNLFKFLGYNQIEIHPSYIFTPSMLTLKTVHSFTEMRTFKKEDYKFFWQKDLSESDIDRIKNILIQIDETNQRYF